MQRGRQFLGVSGHDVLITGDARLPRKRQAVLGSIGVAGDHMQMEVEHRLPRRSLAAVEQVDAVGPEIVDDGQRDSLCLEGDSGQVVGADVEQVGAVLLRNCLLYTSPSPRD